MRDGLARHRLWPEGADRIAFVQQLFEHADAFLFLMYGGVHGQLTFVPRTQHSVKRCAAEPGPIEGGSRFCGAAEWTMLRIASTCCTAPWTREFIVPWSGSC